MPMHEKILPGGTALALRKLGKSGALARAYLAGGTAIALQLGHRISHDLDFFTPVEFPEESTIAALEALGLRTEERHRQTIIGTFEDVHFSYFLLPYPLLFDPILHENLRIAHLDDCAAMKFEAIGSRGTQRDFVDLHAIMIHRQLTIPDLLEMHQKKYGDKHNTRAHNVRSLTYFAEAETEQARPLELLQPIDWEEVKEFFRREVEKTARELLR